MIEFHHEIFFRSFPQLTKEKNIFDVSDWIRKHGETPREYYRTFLSLLVKHAIQLENFMLDERELSFTKEIFLPAFIEVYKETGVKPLIVALEPTEIEGDKFWTSYPYQDRSYVEEKLTMKKPIFTYNSTYGH